MIAGPDLVSKGVFYLPESDGVLDELRSDHDESDVEEIFFRLISAPPPVLDAAEFDRARTRPPARPDAGRVGIPHDEPGFFHQLLPSPPLPLTPPLLSLTAHRSLWSSRGSLLLVPEVQRVPAF